MKAMLEPRMVATSIHVLAWAPGGGPALADSIAASSQGVLMEAMDARRRCLVLKIRASRMSPPLRIWKLQTMDSWVPSEQQHHSRPGCAWTFRSTDSKHRSDLPGADTADNSGSVCSCSGDKS